MFIILLHARLVDRLSLNAEGETTEVQAVQ